MLLSAARGTQQRLPTAQLVLAVAFVLVAIGMIVSGEGGLAVRAPITRGALEAAIAFAALFGALVLLLFPQQAGGRRMWWVAASLIVIGVSALAFGVSGAFARVDEPATVSAYAWVATRTVASLFLCLAVSVRPPAYRRRRAVIATAILGATVVLGVAVIARELPVLIHGSTVSEQAYEAGVRQGLTTAYWIVSALPLVLMLVATIRTPALVRAGEVPWWFAPAMVVFLVGQAHGELWPSAYTSIVTLSDVFRLAFVLMIAAGATITLLRVADEREAMLALERQRSRTLDEEAEVQRDVTAVVSHELAAPLGAIRRLVDTVATGELSNAEQARAMAMIEAEAGMLSALVADIQSLAVSDHGAFPVDLQPVRIADLLRPAADFAMSLPGYHQLQLRVATAEESEVLADPQRIGQVFRNLVSNAAKFSNPGDPIVLQVLDGTNGNVVFEVRDRGWGITADDLDRIFEKYRRGTVPEGGRRPSGIGVGLYLCQRIVRAHGSVITVQSQPGKGSSFSLELERAR